MKIELTTELIKQNQFSTYHGYGDPDNIFNFDDSEIPTDDIYMYWDNDKFMQDWGKCVYNWLEDQLHEVSLLINYKIKTKYISTWSPKYYNYSSDKVNFDLVGDWSLFKKAIIKYLREEDLTDEFNGYLAQNYSSYSGFISFGANNYEDWLEEFNKKDDIAIGAILAYLIDNVKEEYYGEVFEDLYWTNYVDFTEYDKNKELINE
jgi:hypothetical protein